MKKILLFLSIILMLAGCEKKSQRLDPNATIKLRPAAGVKLRAANPDHLTALEIVGQTYSMRWMNVSLNPDAPLRRGFSESQRDYEYPMLKMWGTDIIRQNGEYEADFIEGEDIILMRHILIRKDGDDTIILVADPYTVKFDEIPRPGDIVKDDTIGYVSNQTLQQARNAIKAAYDEGDYENVYRMFDNAFIFHPVTGEEYKILKSQNLN